MITVQMTKNLFDRPPKIFGLFTKKQLISLIIAGGVMLLTICIVPLSFVYRIVVAVIPAVPVVAVGFTPVGDKTASSTFKWFFFHLIRRGDTYVYDGQCLITGGKTARKKIKRHNRYKGMK